MSIRDEVIDALSKKSAELFGVPQASLGEETRFKEDLGAKSVDMVKFCALLEDIYEIEVPYMEIMKKKTFGEVAAFIGAVFGE